MASTIYDIGSLLQLRESLPFVVFNVANLNKHADIAAIASIPPQVFNDPSFTTTTSNLARPLRRKVNKSSEGTEDSMLATGAIKRRPMQQHQWHYRRRDSSDRHQPHSAPTGFAAQQAENFQRFYRAVVSPTHVRVTAGGRIVPNTRAPPPWQWNGDKGLFEHQGSIDSPGSNFEGLFMQAIHHGNMASMDGVTEIEYVQQKQPVKLSHPGHFDATKPFMFNGQLVYPVPPGALPISMMGNQSNFSMHPGLHGQPLMPMPLPKLPHHAPDMPMMPPAHNGRRSGYTMLSAADITKSQIQGLRNHLSQIEHQLANNKLNIDEGFLKKQKQDFTTSIEVMEALLAKQTAQEEISDKTAVKVSEPLSSKDASEMQNVAIKKLKSKLTANAPAFQPRSMGGAPYVVSPNAVSSFPAPTQPLVVQSHPVAAPDEAEDSLLNYCQLDWNKVGTKDGQTIPGLPKASTLYVPASGTQEPLSSLKRSNTFHGHSMSIDSQAVPIIAPNAQPYLVGTYPSYMTGRETRPFNYQYARPLTEAENSARQLYWGQAPRPAQSGLPKFDGKDFYPPSPVKANSRPSTSHEATMPLRTRHSTPLPHNFEDLFTVSDAQVLESPSPSRQMHGSANEGADSHKGEIASPSYQRKQGPLGRPTHGHQHTDSYSHLFIEPSTMSHGSPKTPENAKTAASSHMPSGMTYVASSAQETLVNDDEDDYSDSDSDSVSGVAQGGAPLNLPTKIGFAGRVSSFTKPEQQTHFLHNMLQNTSRGSAATSSGKAPSTPAQGNLSGYRGTAAVSLAPTMSNVPAASGVMSFGSRKDFSKTQSASSFLPENRPLFERGNDRFTESMDAMSYMRHLAQKSSSNGSKDGKESSTTGWV